MKKIFIALFILFLFPITLFGQSKIIRSKRYYYPKDSLNALESKYNKAINNKYAQQLKDICKKIDIEFKDDEIEEKINSLEEAIQTADNKIKPFLKIILAEYYYSYYKRNSSSFIIEQKPTSSNTNYKDFKKWSLPQLFSYIDNLYESVLANEEELSNIPISEYDEFLEKSNLPKEITSNIFEFFAHKALDYYFNNDQSTINPKTDFEIDSSTKVFSNINEFIEWIPEDLNRQSSNYKIIKIYQRLLSLNKKQNNTDALIFNDLERIHWAFKVSIDSEKCYKFVSYLNKTISENQNNKYISYAYLLLSIYYFKSQEFDKAVSFAEKSYNNWPNSYAGIRAYNLINKIKEPFLEMETEDILIPGSGKIKITHKNINSVYFKLIKIIDEEVIAGIKYWDEEEKERLLKGTGYSFESNLNQKYNYKREISYVTLPNVEKGYYLLFASNNPEFSEKKGEIKYTKIQVSNLGILCKSRPLTKEVDFFVVNSLTGEPIEGAELKIYDFTNKSFIAEKNKNLTDKNGHFVFKDVNFAKYNYSPLILCQYKDDNAYIRPDVNYLQDYSDNTWSKVYFFTDRSIYRPGQKVYFKAIAIKYNKEKNEYNVLKNTELEIDFKDPNNQTISNLTLKTNEFGSCNGFFIIPAERLNGNYTIHCNNIISDYKSIEVEEYKRPKFKVEIDSPSEGYQLNKVVKIKGRAKSYTDSVIDNAEVKYRVYRNVIIRRTFWWAPPRTTTQEIMNGVVKTDENGEFTIQFTAKADPRIPRDSEPLFTYSVSADVTDNTGETRSCNKRITLGYKAMKLSIICDSEFNADEKFNFSINSFTLDDKIIPAEGKIKIYSLIQPDSPIYKPYENKYRNIPIFTNEQIELDKLKEGQFIFEDNFSSDNKHKSVELPEGIYRIKAESKDRYGNEVVTHKNVVALSYNSENNSIKYYPFIFRLINNNLKPGDTFKAFWATGYDKGPAYIEIYHKNKVLKSYWTDSNKNKVFITFPITEQMFGGFYVKVFQIKENRIYNINQFVKVDWANKCFNLKLTHFKSKIDPGSKESWKVQIIGENAEKNDIEMLASMYDSSLDAFYNHYWNNFNIFYRDEDKEMMKYSNGYNEFFIFKYYRNEGKKDKDIPNIYYPDFPNYIKVYYSSNYSSRLTNRINEYFRVQPDPRDIKYSPKPLPRETKPKPATDNEIIKEQKNNTSYLAIKEDIDLSNVHSRANLNETAFFLPQLKPNNDGTFTIDFEMPEALTTWKFMCFAHGKNLQRAFLKQEVITQKDLMIQPNAPRFLREGDKVAFPVKVTNLSEKEQNGYVSLELLDATTNENRNSEFKNIENKKSFSVPAKQSRAFCWVLDVPNKPGFIKYKAVGATNTLSDGEEGILPILTSRNIITESLPLPIRWAETKKFKFDKLLNSGNSDKIENKALTVEMTSNPSWYAIQALPYLMESQYDSSEQTFNRFFANKIADHILNSDPKIKKVFEIWEKEELNNKDNSFISNLEKNQHLKSITLTETPWLLNLKNENQRKKSIGILFNENRLKEEIESANNNLKLMQLKDGSFPWFSGGYASDFMTIYIIAGYGRLKNLGIDIDLTIPLKSIDYYDKSIEDWYEEVKDPENNKGINIYEINHLDSGLAFYLYARSFFLKEKPIPDSCKEAINYIICQTKEAWDTISSRMSKAHIAIGLYRFGEKKTAKKIVEYLKGESLANDETGRYWQKDIISYFWNKAEIETQAMMIEMFSEISDNNEDVEDCIIWLLKQKQTHNWKTTKSTADAIYALLLKHSNLLASDNIVRVSLDGKEVKPDKIEAGTGYYEKIYPGNEINPQMGNIQVKKEDNGVAWGAVHWQYLEDIENATPSGNNVKLKKSLYVKTNTERGPVLKPIENGKLNVGDLIVVRLDLVTDRDLEFVHLKDQRGSGMEPVNVISRHKYVNLSGRSNKPYYFFRGYNLKDGFYYYETTKDSASHYFIDYLPEGKYSFEYELRVQLAGEYQSGIAEIMCMYAPEFNAHSGSFLLKVEK